MRKFFYILLIIIGATINFFTSAVTTFAGGNGNSGVVSISTVTLPDDDKGRPCLTCGVLPVKIPVKCKLARLYFTQPEIGPVAIRLYKLVGYKKNGQPLYEITYDRYEKDRMFIKQKADTYSLCANSVARADKITITRCTWWVSQPITFVGDVLRAFKESAKRPIRLPL